MSEAPDVVVVEDDVDLAAMISYALASSGVSVQVYHDGVSARDGILATPPSGTARLLILDVDLPGLDGHSLHEEIRAERPGEFVAAFVSARGGDADQLRALSSGALDYLVKPVSIAVLRAKVRNWLAALRRPA